MSAFSFLLILFGILQASAVPSAVIVPKVRANQVDPTGKNLPDLWDAFRVYASGKVEHLGFRSTEELPAESWLGRGETSPRPSPDGRYVAYTHNRNLRLWDSRNNKRHQVTTTGAAPTKRFTGVYVLISDWSPDSKELLYYLREEVAASGEGGEDLVYPNAVRKPVQFGFYVCNADLNQTHPVNFPRTGVDDSFPNAFEYHAWLPSGDFVADDSDGMVVINPKSGEMRPILRRKGIGQVSSGGTFLVATIAAFEDSQSQIVRIDPGTTQISPLSPVGRRPEFQWPTVSPTGRHVGYAHMVPRRDTNGNFLTNDITFIVDGKSFFQTEGQSAPPLTWIDDNVVAIVDRGISSWSMSRTVVKSAAASSDIRSRVRPAAGRSQMAANWTGPGLRESLRGAGLHAHRRSWREFGLVLERPGRSSPPFILNI